MKTSESDQLGQNPYNPIHDFVNTARINKKKQQRPNLKKPLVLFPIKSVQSPPSEGYPS